MRIAKNKMKTMDQDELMEMIKENVPEGFDLPPDLTSLLDQIDIKGWLGSFTDPTLFSQIDASVYPKRQVAKTGALKMDP